MNPKDKALHIVTTYLNALISTHFIELRAAGVLQQDRSD
jgi:hypothetical protein